MGILIVHQADTALGLVGWDGAEAQSQQMPLEHLENGNGAWLKIALAVDYSWHTWAGCITVNPTDEQKF